MKFQVTLLSLGVFPMHPEAKKHMLICSSEISKFFQFQIMEKHVKLWIYWRAAGFRYLKNKKTHITDDPYCGDVLKIHKDMSAAWITTKTWKKDEMLRFLVRRF